MLQHIRQDPIIQKKKMALSVSVCVCGQKQSNFESKQMVLLVVTIVDL